MSNDSKNYDYIIVGAGSAGCVLANRLSAVPENRVLVIEAGKPDRNWLIHIPLGVGKVWKDDAHNWSYMSEPEPNLDGRQIFHPRGKVVGGSSSINMMAYVRGHRGDYDRWRQMGLDGWAYEDVLPYFKKSESFEDPSNTYHGDSGPLSVQTSNQENPLLDAFLASGESAGYSVTDDYNGEVQEGFARLQSSIRNGRRCSAAVAYLHPALTRPNLELRTGAHVSRLLFEGTRAVGLEYVKDGKSHQVHADADVILSGGSINSPQVLMTSGIGPADHLREMGIDTVHDLAGVGENLQDHPAIGIEILFSSKSEFHKRLRLDRLAMDMIRAHLFATGPAAQPPSGGTAFVKTRPELEIPDIQLFFRAGTHNARQWFPIILPPAEETYTFRACHLRPESRGTVKLRSADPFAPVRIQNNFLSTETDRKTLRDSLHIMRDLSAQSSFDPYRGEEFAPGKEVQTDEQIDAYIRETLATVYHPIGTCRMGSDEASVVDPELRVRGCEGLRVIDASVMPDLAGGNINAVVIMIAEKAADIIMGNETQTRPRGVRKFSAQVEPARQ